VAVDSAAYAVDRFFDYNVPDGMFVSSGMRVSVPFGKSDKIVDAFVAETADSLDERELKDVAAVADSDPMCSHEMIELGKWMRNKYFCTYYQAFRLLLPPGSSIKYKEIIKLCDKDKDVIMEATKNSSNQRAVVQFLFDNNGISTYTELSGVVNTRLRDAVNKLAEKEIITIIKKRFSVVRKKTVRVASLAADYDTLDVYVNEFRGKAPAQVRILELLSDEGDIEVAELLETASAGYKSLEILIRKGLVCIYEKNISRITEGEYKPPDKLIPTME